MTTKICKKCSLEKDILDFRHQIRGQKVYASGVCKKCDTSNGKDRSKKFRETHREQEKQRSKEYYDKNKDEIKERQKDRKKIWDHNYYVKNKKRVQKIQQRRTTERYRSDPNFRVRKTVSKAISRMLRLNGSSKRGQSCLNFLPYSIEELKKYLESQFQPWMTWDNYGRYEPKIWDDNNQMTWTWQIDHIIPQSDIIYSSMEEENFKKCWALENLRPLNAKQNWLDGINRVRHGGVTW